MKRDVILSIAFHLLAVVAVALPLPFGHRYKPPSDVIKVRLLSSVPEFNPAQTPMTPMQVPRAVEAPEPEIPIDDPSTKPAVKVDKPKPSTKPKPKKTPPKEKTPPKPVETGTESQAGSSEGQIDVEATAAGSPFAGATVDNASFSYPFWFDLAFTKIAGNFRNPVNVDATVICVVYFQVIKSGRLLEAKVQESSGYPAFDDACVAAIERSKPFPPLPREFTDEIIGITVPFKNR